MAVKKVEMLEKVRKVKKLFENFRLGHFIIEVNYENDNYLH